MAQKIDMTGWILNEYNVPDSILTVLEEDKEYRSLHNIKSAEAYWKCQCKCGNIISARGSSLRRGDILSCGCIQKQRTSAAKRYNLVGQRFGKLLVLEYSKTYTRPNGKSGDAIWKCQCDCGNITYVVTNSLMSGQTTSCGCNVSSAEELIRTILVKHNVPFEVQKRYNDCRDKNPLPFDFYINNNFLLEYDGEQHYKEWTRGKYTLADRQRHDKIKNDYAKKNHIPLKRIPYWDYDKITFETIMDDTFLLKEV